MPQAPPDNRGHQFTRHQVDGVEVYLPKGLILDAPALTLRAHGFWHFSWLSVQGAAEPQACAI